MSSALTYKFVGTLRSLTDDKPYQRTAIWIGVAMGFAIARARKLWRRSAAYRRLALGNAAQRALAGPGIGITGLIATLIAVR